MDIVGGYDGGTAFDQAVVMRGIFSHRCTPNLFLDGMRMPLAGVNDLNSFLRPDDLVGVEIYPAGTVPAQFDPGLTGCGSIVLWTK